MIVALAVREGAERVAARHRRRARSPSRRRRAPRSSPSARASAHAYDPLGDDEEHSDEASRAVDRDDGTAWTTESYEAGIEGAGKEGVGLYVDAKPKVEAVEMQIETPKPGWKATIYAAPPGPVPKTVPEAGPRSAAARSTSKDKRFKLDTGGIAYRYYLVWITKLADEARSAEISEIRLLQKVAA